MKRLPPIGPIGGRKERGPLMKIKKGATTLLLLCFLALSLSSSGRNDGLESQAEADVITLTLDNGIPLFVLENPNSPVCSLRLFIKGQAQYGEEGKEGLEKLTLSLMTRGSEKYTRKQSLRLQQLTSSSVSSFASSYDLSRFSLKTLSKYYRRTYPLFRDELLHPAWDEEEFDKVKTGLLSSCTKRENDPDFLAGQIVSDNFFGDHPYQLLTSGNRDSLESITLEDVKSYYNTLLEGNRLYFVGVGDFDASKLQKELNRDFGSISFSEEKHPPILPLEPVEEQILSQVFSDSPGLAYVRGTWALPAMSHKDKAALKLGVNILKDILFQILRTENSACYSVKARIYDFQASYGLFQVYKTPVPYNVEDMIKEGVRILASGRCLSAVPEGEELYVPLGEALEFYQARFVTNYYSDQVTNASVALAIGNSFFYRNDPTAYREEAELWLSLSEEDIVGAVNKYILNQPVLWGIVGGEDVVIE
jgi:zinc protease